MKVTSSLSKATSASSKAWLARQSRDPYVKQRANGGRSTPSGPGENGPSASYRSRSAFKLLQLDEKYRLIRSQSGLRTVVVDLGASPGGWSQVVASKLLPGGQTQQTSSKNSIIAVDLLPMEPIAGVSYIRQDFLAPEADEMIEKLLPSRSVYVGQPRVDLILSDIAVNKSGNDTRDAAMSVEVCEAVMRFAEKHLKREQMDGEVQGGSLVMKYFVNQSTEEFWKEVLNPSFRSAIRAKPAASRSESSEFYFVCKGFKGP